MYLSLLALNPRNRDVQKALKHPYVLHCTLMNAFPEGGVHQPRIREDANGVLFRLDEDAYTHLPTVLVQSRIVPDWAGVWSECDARQQPFMLRPVQVKCFQFEPNRGQQLAFRLRANPTKRLSAGKGNKGKRIGIYDVDQQLAWLARKGEQSGFKLLNVQTSRDEKIALAEAIPAKPRPGEVLQEEAPSQKHKLEMMSVQFDGILQVTDPERFLAAVHGGIGSGKAFGFGLLSVAPVR
jgi:CRISPR system Cascade subunit CasE